MMARRSLIPRGRCCPGKYHLASLMVWISAPLSRSHRFRSSGGMSSLFPIEVGSARQTIDLPIAQGASDGSVDVVVLSGSCVVDTEVVWRWPSSGRSSFSMTKMTDSVSGTVGSVSSSTFEGIAPSTREDASTVGRNWEMSSSGSCWVFIARANCSSSRFLASLAMPAL